MFSTSTIYAVTYNYKTAHYYGHFWYLMEVFYVVYALLQNMKVGFYFLKDVKLYVAWLIMTNMVLCIYTLMTKIDNVFNISSFQNRLCIL